MFAVRQRRTAVFSQLQQHCSVELRLENNIITAERPARRKHEHEPQAVGLKYLLTTWLH